MSSEVDAHVFQVNLKGVIDLLAQNLYSSPKVFARELLQNAVDAISARCRIDAACSGQVSVELFDDGGESQTLVFEENGVGLTEDEIHRFLSTIGHSSKRDDGLASEDYIGQFGIGLLSCFVVADEIVLLTRSCKDADAKSLEWRGKPDGTYLIRELDSPISVGTKVYLKANAVGRSYFQPERTRELLAHYGELLPYPIFFEAAGDRERVNSAAPPWVTAPAESSAYVDYGEATFGETFLDYIPLSSAKAGLRGVAYILNHPSSLTAKHPHRIFLKGMLLTEKTSTLLPDWACFVKCVVDAGNLTPTASREDFYENDMLDECREEIDDCLRRHLKTMHRSDPRQLQRVIRTHALAIKALIAEDESCFDLFFEWLPFETSVGVMTMSDLRKAHETVYYVSEVSQFRKISSVAATQGLCVVNAGYVFEDDIMRVAERRFERPFIRRIGANDLVEQFDDLAAAELARMARFSELANVAMGALNCRVTIKNFRPRSLPALFITNEDAVLERGFDEAKEEADDLFAGVLDGVQASRQLDPQNELCLNYGNDAIRRLSGVRSADKAADLINALYIQALLMGQYQLNAGERKMMNESFMTMINWGIAYTGGENVE